MFNDYTQVKDTVTRAPVKYAFQCNSQAKEYNMKVQMFPLCIDDQIIITFTSVSRSTDSTLEASLLHFCAVTYVVNVVVFMLCNLQVINPHVGAQAVASLPQICQWFCWSASLEKLYLVNVSIN